jgi:hypothetical protein
MKFFVPLFIVLLCFSFLFSCGFGGGDDPFSKCKYGKPKPVFEGDYARIDSQRFEIKGMDGIEQVWFNNGMHLELLQQGCDKARQTFHFKLPGVFDPDENWIVLAASQFEYLSAVSEQHYELGIWAQAIQQNSASLSLGEKINLQPGYSVKIDKINAADHAILIVELSED